MNENETKMQTTDERKWNSDIAIYNNDKTNLHNKMKNLEESKWENNQEKPNDTLLKLKLEKLKLERQPAFECLSPATKTKLIQAFNQHQHVKDYSMDLPQNV